jgi:hypothetical protein
MGTNSNELDFLQFNKRVAVSSSKQAPSECRLDPAHCRVEHMIVRSALP